MTNKWFLLAIALCLLSTLSLALSLEGDNLVYDCNGTTVDGISIDGYNNITVTNCTISVSNCDHALNLTNTNSSFFFGNIISSYGSEGCEDSTYPIFISNSSLSNKIYNNRIIRDSPPLQDGCERGPDSSYNWYILAENGTSLTNVLNTTLQNGTRIYSEGTEIGGNYYEVTGCGAYGKGPDAQGYSYLCADGNYDDFCDAPLVFQASEQSCIGTPAACDSSTTFQTRCAVSPSCSWTGSACTNTFICSSIIEPLTCGNVGNESCSCFWESNSCSGGCVDCSMFDNQCQIGCTPDSPCAGTPDACETLENEQDCIYQIGCSWNYTKLTDYLPLKYNTLARLHIVAYDIDTLQRIRFDTTITNGTNTTTVPYSFVFSKMINVLPQGLVNMTFTNSSYYQVDYSTYLLNTTTQYLIVYMTNKSNTNVNPINFIVITQNTQPIARALVQIYRTVNGSNTLVGSKLTDSSGTASFWMDRTVTYTVLTTASGYKSQTSTIIPTNSPYYITLETLSNLNLGFPNSIEGTEWATGPGGCWDQNETINFQTSITNLNCSLLWYSTTLRNGTTVLYTANSSANTCGGVFSYPFIPGPNANISIYIDWQVVNRTAFHQTLYQRTCEASTSVVGPDKAKIELLKGGIGPTAITIIFLLAAVMVAGWVGQFSPNFGVMAFLIVIAFGAWFGFGLLGVGAVMLLVMMVAVGYFAIRGGF